MSTINELQTLVVGFAKERGWQNKPKNVAMSIAIEAAEIMEHYQWKELDEPLEEIEKYQLSLECADVLWYLLRLCESEGIDLAEALRTKHAINEKRFPKG